MESMGVQSHKLEHERLEGMIVHAAKTRGRLEEGARVLAKSVRSHFSNEEEHVLPLLKYLPELAEGQITSEMRAMLPMIRGLGGALEDLRAEQAAIFAVLKDFIASANEERNTELTGLAEELTLHLHSEEQVLYPAAVLIGRDISYEHYNG